MRSFLRILSFIFMFAVLFSGAVQAKEIEFRLVLTDAEAFSEKFEHYIYQRKPTVRGRDLTVSDKSFLKNTDIDFIEIASPKPGGLERPVLHLLFTKPGLEKFEVIKEQYGGREVAILYESKVLTVLDIPTTKVRGFAFYSLEIATDQDAKEFCESIGVKPVFRDEKSGNAVSKTLSVSQPRKALVS